MQIFQTCNILFKSQILLVVLFWIVVSSKLPIYLERLKNIGI